MTSKSKLLKEIISRANKSGSIKGAPHGLIKLKEAIEGVPFELLMPGMSGIFSQGNMMKGIMGMLKQGLNIGDLGSQVSQAIQQAAGAAGISNAGNITKIDPMALAQHIDVEKIIQSMGDNNALTAALSNYIGENNDNTSDTDKIRS